MAELEADGTGWALGDPYLPGGEGGGPVANVSLGEFEGTAEKTRDGGEMGKAAGQPRFHEFIIGQELLELDGRKFICTVEILDADRRLLGPAGQGMVHGAGAGDADGVWFFDAEGQAIDTGRYVGDGGRREAVEFREIAVSDGIAVEPLPAFGYFDFGFARGGGAELGFVDQALNGGGHLALGRVAGGLAAAEGGVTGFSAAVGLFQRQGQSMPEVGLAGKNLGGTLKGVDGRFVVTGG